jgi:hypothetical protein
MASLGGEDVLQRDGGRNMTPKKTLQVARPCFPLPHPSSVSFPLSCVSFAGLAEGPTQRNRIPNSPPPALFHRRDLGAQRKSARCEHGTRTGSTHPAASWRGGPVPGGGSGRRGSDTP